MTTTEKASHAGEAVFALNDYINLRNSCAELEAIESDVCECDPDNFHTCQCCAEIQAENLELRRLMDLWGDHWAVMLMAAIRKAKGE